MYKTVKITKMHYDSLIKLAQKYRMKIEDLLGELIEENYNSKVRR